MMDGSTMLELGGAELNMIDEEHDHDDQINGTVARRQVRVRHIYTGIRRLGHFTAPVWIVRGLPRKDGQCDTSM